MRLIDALSIFLPSLGGWPEGATHVYQSQVDGQLYFMDGMFGHSDSDFCLPICSDPFLTRITREEYEHVLKERNKC